MRNQFPSLRNLRIQKLKVRLWIIERFQWEDILNIFTRRAVPETGFSQTLANVFMKMNDFRSRSRCATAKKPFLRGKSAIFSRFSGHFQNSRIPGSQNSGFRILEFWNSGNLELPKWTILKAEVGTRKRPSNWPFPENPGSRDPRIPKFRILEFLNS